MNLPSLATRVARLVGNVALFLFFLLGGRIQASNDSPQATEIEPTVGDPEFARQCYFNEWSSEKE